MHLSITILYQTFYFSLTLVSGGRRWGGMLEVTQCWSFPEGSTPLPLTPWRQWLPGIADSLPYWSLVGETNGSLRENVCMRIKTLYRIMKNFWRVFALEKLVVRANNAFFHAVSSHQNRAAQTFTQYVFADGKGGFGFPEGEEYMFSMLPLFRADHGRRCLQLKTCH